jgi:hypothetical protein
VATTSGPPASLTTGKFERSLTFPTARLISPSLTTFRTQHEDELTDRAKYASSS